MYIRKYAATVAALVFATGAFAQDDTGKLELTPNHVKYRDAGMQNATGRSGAASIEARALLESDGVAVIEVTTGTLDSDTPAPGNIDKIKIKVGDETTIYQNLDDGGTFYLRRTGLARYTPIQFQVNVSGIDPARADIVTVDEVVKLQPYLRIVEVQGPGAALPGQPFTVAALIREYNGDVGARANCVLTDRDGNVVDRADDIWVDAGDTVQCLFTHTAPATLGLHTYFVRLQNIRPKGWGWSEPLVGFNMLVTTARQWEASSTQRTLEVESVSTRSDQPDRPETSSSTEINDLFNFHAAIDTPLDYETVRFSIEERTDGNLIYRYDPVGGLFGDNAGCRMSDRRHALYTICRFGDRLALNAVSFAGNAVYLSQFWIPRFDPAIGQYVYVLYTMRMTSRFGPGTRYASTHDVRMRLTDGVSAWEASPFIHLQPWEKPAEQTTHCRELYDGVTECTQTTIRESGKSGSASLD